MKALIFGYIQKFVLSPPELYSPDTKVEKLGLTQSIIPINYYIISKNFENSKIWHHFQELSKFLEKFSEQSSINLCSPYTMSNFQAVQIFDRIFDFILGKYNLTNSSTSFSFENFENFSIFY